MFGKGIIHVKFKRLANSSKYSPRVPFIVSCKCDSCCDKCGDAFVFKNDTFVQ